MNQNFSSKELKRHLKKGELYRNDIKEEDLITELSEIENKIINQNFTFNIKSNDSYYFVEDIPEKLVLRKLNDNIKRIYKDEQANRKFVIQQIKTLFTENAPFWIIKTDIKSFYESIDRNKVIEKLKNDAMLSYYSISLINTIFNNSPINSSNGLPRGINLSSTLSEIYMRKFDKWIQRHIDVYYYARFVDDIVIFVSNKDSALNMFNSLDEKLKEFTSSLIINKQKTELFDGNTLKRIKSRTIKKNRKNNIEFLGYNFFVSEDSSKKEKKITVSIAEKKVKKIKTRIINTYLDFCKNNDYDLLEKRVKFLTGNYGINKNSDDSILKAGIYYNYSHLNNNDILNELNVFHRRVIYSKKNNFGSKINSSLSLIQKQRLKKYCFNSGFHNKTYNSFKYQEMGEITNCWK
ncbi:RNA-directed DNA polymerase [Tenacibaculum finnmarkense]|uniref:antiviral reverse transcriptase Drt3a n=1 Tax=Tenacibaculum finnmarkense TaxID=2781243 RepID=UPI001EFB0DAE|nr:antiviral reverse transcriptase Drt3a [Tenacibaculum finnmarkense]MCG8806477.1 RNA-directed DNA polymerase [Tenacibaculum finnmarkense]MCG8857603.1 RNA-directed DNA polymerase [Tenacibaculum finnmarkense]